MAAMARAGDADWGPEDGEDDLLDLNRELQRQLDILAKFHERHLGVEWQRHVQPERQLQDGLRLPGLPSRQDGGLAARPTGEPRPLASQQLEEVRVAVPSTSARQNGDALRQPLLTRPANVDEHITESEIDRKSSITTIATDVEHIASSLATSPEQPGDPKAEKKKKKKRHRPRLALKFDDFQRSFYRHLAISLRVALACTIFGAPILYDPAHVCIFGDKICESWQLGKYVRATTPDGKPTVEPFNETSGRRWDSEHNPGDVWCGYVPNTYVAYWPNVVQYAIYTVYVNCGLTTQLAWQGGIGTVWSTINIYLMMGLFPHGARDPNYVAWVAWFDFFLIIFIFLISLAETNTLKFGMSWHVYFMMSFMNPNKDTSAGRIPTGIPGVQWDSEATCVLLTSLLGAFLAVVVTYLPYPLLNFSRLEDDANNVADAIENIWTEAINYFLSDSRTAKRFQIQAKVKALSSTVKGMSGHLDASWWETFNLFRFGRKRSLYTVMERHVESTQQVLYTMNGCTRDEDFKGKHRKFCNKQMKVAMLNLKHAAATLMKKSANFAEDGHIDDEEKDQLNVLIKEVAQRQKELRQVFLENPAIMEDSWVSDDLLNENIFVYALSVWAELTVKFVNENLITRPEQHGTSRDSTCAQFLSRPIAATWNVDGLTDNAHRNFAARNFVSISICFVCGYLGKGSIFGAGYQYQMANTLTLMISRVAGVNFEYSMMRLIAGALAKVLPILLMALLTFFPVGSPKRAAAHAFFIFVYIFCFEYMYFTSPRWAVVGLLTAAFGCQFLFTPDSSMDLSPEFFGDRYQEIGCVIAAILVQILVDTTMRQNSTRKIAVHRMEKLRRACEAGFMAFFAGEENLEDYLAGMKVALAAVVEYAPYVDPKVSVVRGPETPMKGDLYKLAVDNLTFMVSDFEMIKMVAGREIYDFLARNPTFTREISEDFKKVLSLTLRALCTVLEHAEETQIMDPDVVKLEAHKSILSIGGLDVMFMYLHENRVEEDPENFAIFQDIRMRLAVALKALENARAHTGYIAAGIIECNIH